MRDPAAHVGRVHTAAEWCCRADEPHTRWGCPLDADRLSAVEEVLDACARNDGVPSELLSHLLQQLLHSFRSSLQGDARPAAPTPIQLWGCITVPKEKRKKLDEKA